MFLGQRTESDQGETVLYSIQIQEQVKPLLDIKNIRQTKTKNREPLMINHLHQGCAPCSCGYAVINVSNSHGS